MDNKEYTITQLQLMTLATEVNQLDLEGFLAAISKAEAVAPVVDPTLWMRGHKQLGQLKKLAKSFRLVQCEIRRQIESEKERIEDE